MSDFRDIGKVYDDFFGGSVTGPGIKNDGPDPADPIQKGIDEILPSLASGSGEIPESLKKDIETIRKMVAEDFHLQTGNGIPSGNEPAASAPPTGSGNVTQPSGTGAGSPGAQENNAAEKKEEAAGAEPRNERPPMEELDELIGLDSIKKDVKDLIDLVKAQRMRSEQGMKTVPVSLHLVFSGNPGTGKTTVARILARLYKEIGALSKGQLVEVDRSGLVAGFVGQTALRTQEKIQEAMGGVLFIDEAYTLAKEGNDFGQEAIDTILKAMEDHRDDLVVIVAGYTDLMEKFINSNPGLKSRFNKYFEFPDYTAEELFQIFHLQCKKYDYVCDPEAETRIRERINQMEAEKGENFANARDVRNLFEQIITRQATRIAKEEAPDAQQLRTILSSDLP